MVSTYLNATRKSKKGLYLPAFGLGFVASTTGKAQYLILAFGYATLVAIIEPWLDALITLTIDGIENNPTRYEAIQQMWSIILPRVMGKDHSRLPMFIFLLVILGYLLSFAPYFMHGFENKFIVFIAMLQWIIPVTALSNFVISVTSEIPA